MLNNDTAMRGVSRFFSDNEHGGFLAGDFFGRFAEHAPVHIGALEDGDKTDGQLAGLRKFAPGLVLRDTTLPARVVDSPPPGNYPCCRRRGGACVNINTR